MSAIGSNSGSVPGLRPSGATEGVARTLRRGTAGGEPGAGATRDPAVTVSADLDADRRAFQALQQNLASGTGLVAAALGGANSTARLLGALRATATEAARSDNSAERQESLASAFAATLAELGAAVAGAGYSERNLLVPGAENVTLTAALSGGQLTIESVPAVGAVAEKLAGGVGDPRSAAALLAVIDEQAQVVSAALEKLGASQKSLEFQSSFVTTIAESSASAVSSLVDADLAAEAAKIRALQVKQQLGGTPLGIANQRPQSLLSLFDK